MLVGDDESLGFQFPVAEQPDPDLGGVVLGFAQRLEAEQPE
jgi:hypothetical protein